MEQRRRLRLGEIMVQQGLISQDQLRIALIEQGQNKIPLGRQMVRLGFVSESMVRDLVEQSVNMVRAAKKEAVQVRAQQLVEDAILDILIPPVKATNGQPALGFDENTKPDRVHGDRVHRGGAQFRCKAVHGWPGCLAGQCVCRTGVAQCQI